MAFRQIKSPALANAAVIDTKLDATSVSGQTGASSVVSADTLLLHVNASSSLKKVTASDFIGSFDTDDIAEGSKKYFTDALAQAAVASDIAAAVLVETNRATAAEGVNTTAIAAEETRALAAEGVNATAIAAEETRALAAEGAIDTAYKAADASMQTQINNIISNTDPAALDSLSEIVTAFQSADSVFTSGIAANAAAITAETTRATAAEGVNATNIANEITRAQGVEATNAAAVVTEAGLRTAADNALDARVTANEGDITTLTNGLAAEITATNGDISTLTTNLAAEITRATGAEAANATDIAAEETARQNADTSIRTDFAAADTAQTAANTTAWEAYADQAEVDAKAYTDTRETAINTAWAAADAAQTTSINAAWAAADTAQTTANTTAWEAYADQVEVDAKAYTDTREVVLQGNIDTETARIDSIISNTDPASLDSLTEIVAAFQAADSNFQALISSNTTAIATEASARASADTTLQANITAEAGTRASADTTLQGNIDAEETARIAGDAATLASAATDATTKANAAQAAAIAHADTEDAALIGDATVDGTAGNTVTDRITDGDAAVTTAFGNADTAITTAFTAADTALQLQITANDGDIATNTGDIATNTAAIAQEVTDRTTADNTLQANITAEATTARAAELANSQAITAEATTARAAEAANTLAISNEVTRASGIEAGLRTDVDANTVTGSTNAAAITTEATARAAADLTLQGNIDTETARIDSILLNADGALDTLKEIGDAFAAADSTLQGLITANGTRLTTNEGDIDTLETEMDAAELRLDNLEAVVQSAGQSLDTTATTLVGAINEVHGEVNTNTTNIGVIGDLDTTASDLVGAINEVHGEVDTNLSNATTDRAAIRSEFAAADGVVTAAYIAADVVVTGAFQAADAAQTTALQAYADTAEADAITAAGTYTDAEVLTEKTRAEAAELVLTNGLAAEASTARAAEQANAAAAAANLLEITATQASGGLNLDGTYTAHSGSNYIDAGSNLKAVDLLLDAQAKANADAIAGEITDRTTAVAAEATTARAAELANANAIAAETTRATGVENTLSGLITTNATAISTESARAQAAEGVNATAIANIISNTDPAALDSLTEIVAAFQADDGTITALVNANTTDIATNTAGLAQELIDRAAADTALDTAYKAADTTLQSNIDLKLALAGGTMSGNIAMGSNKVTGLANGTDANDAINKSQLDAAVSALDLSNFDTNDLDEGTGPTANLYFTDARARAAISVTDTAGNGLASYDSATGVITINTNESVLDLTDVSDTDYTGKEDYVLRVNANEDGMELVSPLDIFAHNWRQTIPGDGVATQFALTNPVDQSDALVFVGGVIQDPVTHYSIANQVITMTSAMPVGTAAVVVAPSVGLVPVLSAGQVTTDKLSADIKAYVQGSNVSTTTGGDVIDTFAKATYRSAKYIIQADDGNGNYETREALVTHDGTTAYITEYAMVYTGSNLVGDASVNMNGNNVELTYTTNSGTATVKVISTYIDV